MQQCCRGCSSIIGGRHFRELKFAMSKCVDCWIWETQITVMPMVFLARALKLSWVVLTVTKSFPRPPLLWARQKAAPMRLRVRGDVGVVWRDISCKPKRLNWSPAPFWWLAVGRMSSLFAYLVRSGHQPQDMWFMTRIINLVLSLTSYLLSLFQRNSLIWLTPAIC